jgi:hypothetical protein
MTTTSGYKCLESGKTDGNVGLLEEACLKSSIWNSSMVLLTWKHKVTKQGNIIFQLGIAKPNASEDDPLWRTPSAQDPGVSIDRLVTKDGDPAQLGQRAYDKTTGRLAQCGLTQQVQMWRTPCGSDGEGGVMAYREGANAHYKLRDQVMWSTPRESDGSGGASLKRISGDDHRHQLREEVFMWPTPQARDYRSPDNNPNSNRYSKKTELNTAVMWPTPQASDANMRQGIETESHFRNVKKGQLASVALESTKMWPTPTAPGLHQVGKIEEWGGSGNPLRGKEKIKGFLNPNWVEWLMGFPKGWTDLTGDS